MTQRDRLLLFYYYKTGFLVKSASLSLSYGRSGLFPRGSSFKASRPIEMHITTFFILSPRLATLQALKARHLTAVIPPTGYSILGYAKPSSLLPADEYLIYPLCARKGKATPQEYMPKILCLE